MKLFGIFFRDTVLSFSILPDKFQNFYQKIVLKQTNFIECRRNFDSDPFAMAVNNRQLFNQFNSIQFIQLKQEFVSFQFSRHLCVRNLKWNQTRLEHFHSHSRYHSDISSLRWQCHLSHFIK